MTFEEFKNAVELSYQNGQGSFRDFRADKDEKGFRVLLDTEPGRDHLVFVRNAATDMGDVVIATALALELPKGKELTAEMAIHLLKRNAAQAIGRWCVIENNEGKTCVGVCDVISMEHADAAWAFARLKVLASVADEFEAELGRDVY